MPRSQRHTVDVTLPHVNAVASRPSPVVTGRAGMIAALQAQAGNRALAGLLSRSGPQQRSGGQSNGGCDNDTAEVLLPTVQRDAAAATKIRNSIAKSDLEPDEVFSPDRVGRALADPCSPLPPQRCQTDPAGGGVVQRTTPRGSTCAGPGRCACAGCTEEEAQEQPAPDAGSVQRDTSTGATLDIETVQRQPKTDSPGTVPNGYRVKHTPSRLNFNDDPGDVRKTLEGGVAAQGGEELLDDSLYFHEAYYLGPVPPAMIGSPLPTCDLDPGTCSTYRQRVQKVVQDEVKKLRSRVEKFSADFQLRAKDTVLLLLNDSEAKINQEKERYGLQKKDTWWGLSTEYSLNNAQDLTVAAKDLLEKYFALKTATDAMAKITDLGPSGRSDPSEPGLPPGGTEGMATAEDRSRVEADVKAKEADYSILRKQKEGDHPILITYDLDPAKAGTHGVLATLAADSGGTKAEMLYKTVEEKLENIRTTRDHITDHPDAIWKLETIVGITKKLPDISGHKELSDPNLQKVAIDKAKATVQLQELMMTVAIAAISIGLGMVAGPLAASGMRVAAGAALLTDAGIGIAQTLAAIHQFEFEKAANDTDFDSKARSISQEEPSLFWLAVEIVMTITQLKAAADEFRGIVRLSRAATAAKIAKDERAAKLLDELAENGDKVKPNSGIGDRLRRQAESLGTTAGQDAEEIAANLEKITESAFPGYTHEIPMGDGKFWRRSADGHWCSFASPPRCGVVIDQLVTGTPHLAGINLETFAALMSRPRVLKAAKQDVRAGMLLEKYGVSGVKAMEQAPLHGEFPVELLARFDAISEIPGAERLLGDLAAGSTTTKGAIGELYYIEILRKKGTKIERIADVMNTPMGPKKAADIVLKDGKRTVIDVKYYDWNDWRWKVPAQVKEKADELAAQVARRKKEYPGSPIIYVFAGDVKDVPQPIVKALTKAGATVKGTI